MPEEAKIEFAGVVYLASRLDVYACICSGLWSGLLIGFITEYYTSNRYAPV